jgi:hypothetical protein
MELMEEVECKPKRAAPKGMYIYSWGPRFCVPGLPVLDRKGQRCALLARGAMNSALVEFEDGYLAVISRNALRKGRLALDGARRRNDGRKTWTVWASPRHAD